MSYRDTGQGPRYSDENLLLPAAIAGLGVALARASLVEADLESARLVRLFSQSVRTRYSYFIVYPPGSESTGKIQVFQEWLFKQVRPGQREGTIGARAGKEVPSGTPRLVRLRRVTSG